jgi:hypothetical protein
MLASAVGRSLFKATNLFPVVAVLLLHAQVRCHAATVLPVGPITFSANSDYDKAFKEPAVPQLDDMQRDAAGYLSVFNTPTSVAIYDTSASGGAGGNGGVAGSDANKDLSDFTISADFASSFAGVGGGFLLRLNASEAGGYTASVHNLNPFVVAFDLFEGSSAVSAGINIFSTVVPLPNGFSVAPNTFYTFKVAAVGGTFTFDFAGGAAKASFVDFNPSATVGQVGIVLDNLGPGGTARLDNFRIAAVPEPSSLVLAVLAGVLLLWCRLRNQCRKI